MDDLQQLVKTWRQRAAAFSREVALEPSAPAIEVCADELEAALRGGAEGERPAPPVRHVEFAGYCLSCDVPWPCPAASVPVVPPSPPVPDARDSRGYVLPKYVAVVEKDGGGCQLEGHTGAVDWELELGASGELEAFSVRPRAGKGEPPVPDAGAQVGGTLSMAQAQAAGWIGADAGAPPEGAEPTEDQ